MTSREVISAAGPYGWLELSELAEPLSAVPPRTVLCLRSGKVLTHYRGFEVLYPPLKEKRPYRFLKTSITKTHAEPDLVITETRP